MSGNCIRNIQKNNLQKTHHGESVKFGVSRYLGKLEYFNNIGAMHCFKFKVFRNNAWISMHSKPSKKHANMDNLWGLCLCGLFILPIAETALLMVVSHLRPARWWLWCDTNQLCQPPPAPTGAAHAENHGCYFLPAPRQTRKITPWEYRQNMFIFTSQLLV